ncbi:MAG: MgtC/SapB family protein [Acidobacteriota bacterium]
MSYDLGTIFQQLGIGLGLGLLVGLQRESAASKLAGVRTFPLVTILGTTSALLAQSYGGWIVATGLLALTGMIVIGKYVELESGTTDPGLTTEVALLLMYGVGAYIVMGAPVVAIAIGGGTAVLLHFKMQLHGIVARLGETDLKAIMQFVLISLVILPILPDRTYGPYAVLNPQKIWLVVVLIVGISLIGYIAYKFLGEKIGVILGGILGGLISSTATTVSYAKFTANTPTISRQAAIVITLASMIVYARLLLEIATVAASFLPVAAPPLLIMLALFALLSIIVWFWHRDNNEQIPAQENPTQLKSALAFGLLYAIVLFAVAAAKETFGDKGLFIVAGISGLTDVDAITLSTSQLVIAGRLSAQSGWKLILLATMSNLGFKAIIVTILGHRQLAWKIILLHAIALSAGALLLGFW